MNVGVVVQANSAQKVAELVRRIVKTCNRALAEVNETRKVPQVWLWLWLFHLAPSLMFNTYHHDIPWTLLIVKDDLNPAILDFLLLS